MPTFLFESKKASSAYISVVTGPFVGAPLIPSKGLVLSVDCFSFFSSFFDFGAGDGVAGFADCAGNEPADRQKVTKTITPNLLTRFDCLTIAIGSLSPSSRCQPVCPCACWCRIPPSRRRY